MFKHLHGKKLCVIALKKFYKHVVYDSITERFFRAPGVLVQYLRPNFFSFFFCRSIKQYIIRVLVVVLYY